MALINCPNCGKQISDKAANCIGCGFALASVGKCEECGAILDPGAKFCTKCGCPVQGAAQSVQPAAPAAVPAPQTAPTWQAALSSSDNRVIVEGDSGKLPGSLVLGILALICAVRFFIGGIIFIVQYNQYVKENPVAAVLNTPDFQEEKASQLAGIITVFVFFIIFIIIAVQRFRFFKGYQIKVTASTITGYAYWFGIPHRGVYLPVKEVLLVEMKGKNKLVIISAKNNRKYKFDKLPNCGEIYNEINKLLPQKMQ